MIDDENFTKLFVLINKGHVYYYINTYCLDRRGSGMSPSEIQVFIAIIYINDDDDDDDESFLRQLRQV